MSKVLIIDNDAHLLSEVTDWLDIEGFEVLSATDGINGVKHAYRHVPHLIVCDVSVPQLDGYGVLLEIRSNPATAETPVIFLTADTSYNKTHPNPALAADDYITKPFTQHQFLEIIKRRLQKKADQEHVFQQRIDQLEQALATEQEQRLLKAKLTAMVAHDFRNPLTSILSSNGLLRDYSDRMDEERRELHRSRIDASVNRMLTMLDEMLILAQIDSGNLEFKPEPMNLEFFFQRIVEEFEAIHTDTHELTFESRFHAAILADARLLEQIASNLIANAIKYSPAGGAIHVTLDKNDEQVILSVQDSGIGIAAADQLLIFDAFHRGTNVGSIPGTGLGMTVVKQAIVLHGGSIDIESSVGSGTTMRVLFPMIQM